MELYQDYHDFEEKGGNVPHMQPPRLARGY